MEKKKKLNHTQKVYTKVRLTLLCSSTLSSTISSVLRERLKVCSSSMSSAGRLPVNSEMSIRFHFQTLFMFMKHLYRHMLKK